MNTDESMHERPFTGFRTFPHVFLWFSHPLCHVVPSANKHGGMVSQCVKKVYCQKDVTQGKVKLLDTFDQLRYLIQGNFAMLPLINGMLGKYHLKSRN